MNKPTERIYNSYINDIATGSLKASDKLPTEKEIAEKFSTNKMNAQRAIQALQNKGLVTRIKKKGSFICDPLDQQYIDKLHKATKKRVYVLCSSTPYNIHWDQTTFNAMENKLKPDGYELIYDKLPKSDSSKSWQECLHKAKEFSPSALLIFPDAGDNKYIEKQKAEILDLNTRILMLNRGTGEVNLPNTSFVTYDILDEGIKIAKILSSEASSRLIYISSENPDCYWDKVRLEGLVIGLSQASSNNEKKLTIFKGEHKNYSKICNIIKTNSKVKPPVIIPVNNQHAAKFMDIARAKGLNAPENFRLISFDDNPMYRTYNISTLAHPLVKTGEIFANLIKSPPQYHENCNISIMLCSHFIRRNTF